MPFGERSSSGICGASQLLRPSRRKSKIKNALGYLGTPHEQAKLPAYMKKHGLTHEEVHRAGEDEEEEAA